MTIRDPRAALVFNDSRSRRILLQFAREPRAVAEVALAISMDLKQLHHFVTRFHRLGLLRVAEERKRTGRSIKLYQCMGDRYFIPAKVVTANFSRGLAKELRAAIERDTAATVEGMVFSLDADGRVCAAFVQKASAGNSPMDSWRILNLSAARADQLKKELAAVLDRFQSIPEPRGEVYLVHAGMARRPNHQGVVDNPLPANRGVRAEGSARARRRSTKVDRA